VIVAGLSNMEDKLFHIFETLLTSFIVGFGFAVGNALKFTHKGSVTVGVRVVAEDTIVPLGTHDGKIIIGFNP